MPAAAANDNPGNAVPPTDAQEYPESPPEGCLPSDVSNQEKVLSSAGPSEPAQDEKPAEADDEYEHFYGSDPPASAFHELDKFVEARYSDAAPQSTQSASEGQSEASKFAWGTVEEQARRKEMLDKAVRATQAQPFFSTKSPTIDRDEGDSDDEGDDGGEETALPGPGASGASLSTAGTHPWFRKPKNMSASLYTYFGKVVKPMISCKEGKFLKRPPSYEATQTHSATMWLTPSDAVFSLARYRLDPNGLQMPDVLLWLPHFLITLCCPTPGCTGTLEKNGPTPPRRIVDLDKNFYIVTWQYYCRDGCRHYYSGWSPTLLASLPRWLQLAFPAVISRKGGLARRVITLLRASNQHKMGPSGVRDLMLELHTLRFSTLQLQYLEAGLEMALRQEISTSTSQQTLHSFIPTTIPDFGNFGSLEGYNGFVPSVQYLTTMMNRAIEHDELTANQHTALLAPDQIAITKHIAKVQGVSIFGALWTCMDSRYIRAQALTLTKAHDERLEPLMAVAQSMHRYGYDDPPIAFSDDPVKDKSLLSAAFPGLSANLTPMAVAYGREPLSVPTSVRTILLDSPTLVEAALSSLMNLIEDGSSTSLVVGFDAEWNISRGVGVSVIQLMADLHPDEIFIIPVHRYTVLPPSLIQLLVSPKVYKVGSAIKADFTRLKKQFAAQLAGHTAFNLIDLKEYCIRQGALERNRAGSLDALVESVTGKHLFKDDGARRCDDWEIHPLRNDLRDYAALDVYATLAVFQEAHKRTPPLRITPQTPPSTQVTLFSDDDAFPIAHGTISETQTARGIRVKVPSNNRVVIAVNQVLIPGAAATLHPLPKGRSTGHNKVGSYSLQQLQSMAPAPNSESLFLMVARVEHLVPYKSSLVSITPSAKHPSTSTLNTLNAGMPFLDEDTFEDGDSMDLALSSSSTLDSLTLNSDQQIGDSESGMMDMFQAYSAVERPEGVVEPARISDTIRHLEEIISKPADSNLIFTRIKKDIFHGFNSLPLSRSHGATAPFLRALRDHMFRYDEEARQQVDKVCREKFGLTFEGMLARNSRFITERVPRFVPAPSILVAAMEHVFSVFENAKDAKTGEVLFTPSVCEKANALLDLARQGYFSDIEDVPMYEKAGIDKYGLQKWRCLRGTNNVEGGPHGDIYRKFGALNAGPQFTVNCLTDHRTWYNLQAWALHLFGLDYEYHHDLSMINRVAFLLNFLSDMISGASAYRDWITGDLYEQTSEGFGVCIFPDSLRARYCMEPFTEQSELRYPKLSRGDNWLRKRQGLALPVLPPTTLAARQYFFEKVRHFTEVASANRRTKVDFVTFSQEWNRTADGEQRVYITPEVLSAYGKSWEKANNIRASEDLIYAELESLKTSKRIFAAGDQPFPPHLTTQPTQHEPLQGVRDIVDGPVIPDALSIAIPISHPIPSLTQSHSLFHTSQSGEPIAGPSMLSASSSTASLSSPGLQPSMSEGNDLSEPAKKRRRVIPSDVRKYGKIRTCRRCGKEGCNGLNNIDRCLENPKVPCRKCHRLDCRGGADGGKNCSHIGRGN
ncbi:hypothetical protein FA13DRAFT_1819084 [Coprinellus micaceus]|uniref:3'-5' exonuclease n=1 Tax=Coprinellus micaceus TaxID=71717 RepID=A0A4Y7SKE1_COPMI|nr:hypothetical protein FA13DRAFT_1819084 [Coprinellus micaceus]